MNRRQQAFSQWLNTEPGQRFVSAEADFLAPILSSVHASSALLLGDPGQLPLAKVLSAEEQIVVHPFSLNSRLKASVHANYEELPLAPDSLQLALLPHTLEFAQDPHQVLRQLEIAMRPEGYLIIVGFKPLSLWKIKHLIHSKGVVAGTFRAKRRVADWLNLLGFDVIKENSYCFSPFFHQHFAMIERLAQYTLPFMGGLYVIIAKKNILGVTPQRLSQKRCRKLIKKPAVKPTTRNIIDDR